MIALPLHARAALAAAALLALPAVAGAQAKPRAAASGAVAKPAATPAPRPSAAQDSAPLAAVAPVAPMAPEPDAPLNPLAAPIEERGPWRTAVALGYEKDSDSDVAGPRIQAEAIRDLVPLGSRGRLDFVAAVAWFHGSHSDSQTITLPLAGSYTVKTDTKVDLFELVPSFRASFALFPRLRAFAELGVGAGWAQGKVETSSSAVPGVVEAVSHDSFLGVLRLSAGATFAVDERLRLGVELPTFSKRYGEAKSQTVSFSATAAYAF